MVGFDAQILQALLNVDANRGAASPDAYDKIGPKAAVKDRDRQLEGLLEQLLLFNKLLFHVNVLNRPPDQPQR